MISFKNFILERKVDPEKLAVKAAKIYGKKTNYGFWEPPEKYENIPLSNFNDARAQKVTDKIWSYQRNLRTDASVKVGTSDEEKRAAYRSKFSEKIMKISDLHATQPFIRTNDKEQLKNKINNTSPDNIRIVKYKNKHYVMDGHHAVMAAKFRGEKEIKVSHFDLDTELSKKKD